MVCLHQIVITCDPADISFLWQDSGRRVVIRSCLSLMWALVSMKWNTRRAWRHRLIYVLSKRNGCRNSCWIEKRSLPNVLQFGGLSFSFARTTRRQYEWLICTGVVYLLVHGMWMGGISMNHWSVGCESARHLMFMPLGRWTIQRMLNKPFIKDEYY